MQSSQRYAIKCCVKLGDSGPETVEMVIATYKENALSRAQFYRWYKVFKDRRESVEDEEQSVRPVKSRTTKIDV